MCDRTKAKAEPELHPIRKSIEGAPTPMPRQAESLGSWDYVRGSPEEEGGATQHEAEPPLPLLCSQHPSLLRWKVVWGFTLKTLSPTIRRTPVSTSGLSTTAEYGANLGVQQQRVDRGMYLLKRGLVLFFSPLS